MWLVLKKQEIPEAAVDQLPKLVVFQDYFSLHTDVSLGIQPKWQCCQYVHFNKRCFMIKETMLTDEI